MFWSNLLFFFLKRRFLNIFYILFFCVGCSNLSEKNRGSDLLRPPIDISGVYMGLSDGNQKVSLLGWLFPRNELPFTDRSIECVKFYHSAKTITLEGLKDHQIIYKRVLIFGTDYTISDGHVEFKVNYDIAGFKSGDPLLGLGIEKIKISRGEGNKLTIAKSIAVTGLVYMFMPIIYQGECLHSFEQC
ncbi:hypothetical protein ACET6Z_05480 [Aeromonas veronii]